MIHKSDQFIVVSKFAEILVFRANDFQVLVVADFKFWGAKQQIVPGLANYFCGDF